MGMGLGLGWYRKGTKPTNQALGDNLAAMVILIEA